MNKKEEIKRIEDFIYTKIQIFKMNGVVLGISGGVDSAVVATLCVEALGENKVHGFLLPYGLNKMEDAVLMVNKLHIKSETINIEPICKTIGITGDKKVDGNVMARVRMVCLYKYANEHNLIVVGTGNRSEIMMGYFTKYGDGGVDISPIAHLYKTEVWEIAKTLGVPDKIIKKIPSAELYDGQTDEGEMGVSYKNLDYILKRFDAFDIIKGDENLDKNIGKAIEIIVNATIKSTHKRLTPLMLRRRE
jgi:NAD+ synthase